MKRQEKHSRKSTELFFIFVLASVTRNSFHVLGVIRSLKTVAAFKKLAN